MATSKKNLKEQLNAAARKYAKENAGGDIVMDAFISGGLYWGRIAHKPTAHYEKILIAALEDRNGQVSLWERTVQVPKTARMWEKVNRLHDELDMEEQLMRYGMGSTKQVTETLDERMSQLRQWEKDLTCDFTALGLNYNSTPSKIKEDTRRGVDAEKDGLSTMLNAARKNMTDIPDIEQ